MTWDQLKRMNDYLRHTLQSLGDARSCAGEEDIGGGRQHERFILAPGAFCRPTRVRR